MKTFELFERAIPAITGGQRKGQALMNALHEMNRQAYLDITATEADPFYDDKKIPLFLDTLEWHWGFE